MHIEGATTWRHRSPNHADEFIGVAALSCDELLVFSVDAEASRAIGGDGTGNVPTGLHAAVVEHVTSGQARGLQRIPRAEIVEVGFVRSSHEVRMRLASHPPIVLSMASARHAVRVGATLGQVLFPGREPRLERVAVTGLRPGGRFASKTKPLVVLALSLVAVGHLTQTDRFATQTAQGNSSAIQTMLASIPLWAAYLVAMVIVAYAAYEYRNAPVPTYELRAWSAEAVDR